jgi:hypothetical protein
MRYVFALLALLSAAPASASQFQPIALSELVAGSDAVVQLRVVSTTAAWEQNGRLLVTTAEVQVVRALRGPRVPGETFTIREVGGTVAGYTVDALGFPQLVAGDELVVFLTRWPDGTPRISAYGQGFYQVVRTDGVERLVPGPTQGERPDARVVGPAAGETVDGLAVLLGR